MAGGTQKKKKKMLAINSIKTKQAHLQMREGVRSNPDDLIKVCVKDTSDCLADTLPDVASWPEQALEAEVSFHIQHFVVTEALCSNKHKSAKGRAVEFGKKKKKKVCKTSMWASVIILPGLLPQLHFYCGV